MKDENGAVVGIGPDLPGQLALGAPAMFDACYYLKTRSKLRTPGMATSRYTEHYLITSNDGLHVGKNRSNLNGVALLAPEETFDITTGQGDFTSIRNKILAGYQTLPA